MSAHRAHHQPLYIIAAHGGAGYHQPASDSSLKRSLRAAISSALPAFSGATVRSDITSSGGSSSESSSSWSALDATTAVIATLEDHPDFNAGYGSNLTFDGRVECDASLMLSTTEERSLPSLPSSSSSSPSFSYSFGSVGAVRGVRNPVLLARCVLEERIRERGRGPGMARMGMGCVPPLMLVGEGAVQFARERGVRVVDAPDSEEMVAPRAREEWRVWRERCSRWKDDDDGFESRGLLQGEGNELELEDAELEPLRVRQDTVGAVVLVGDVEQKLEVAAGVSSGGILLKHSGRVGEAAIFGSGCWAERSAGGRSVACSVSGQGELIMQSFLAKTLAERTVASAEVDTHEVLRSVLVDQFYDKWNQRGEHQPAVGVLLLTQGVDGDESTARLWCAFTTQSMAVAYASSRQPKPKARVLRNTAHDFSNENGPPPFFITTLPC
ncbi:nucleophile aminohydrolase [Russula emetica]|nr:nucleophile aminohydrolase [Russula emetica]